MGDGRTLQHADDQRTGLGKAAHRGPVPSVRMGDIAASLVNGVFGDPLLRVQLLHRRRSLLFDLGDPGRMAARVAHQVSDIFLSHTHADHIGGFLWFLRSRVGVPQACRVYGPAGVAKQIAGMVGGILWDRVEDRAPRFEICEWHGDHLRHFSVMAGLEGAREKGESENRDGVLWREPALAVRATELDHGTPVLAYAIEPRARINVCRDRLDELGLPTGPWLQALKEACLEGELSRVIDLPGGGRTSAGHLQEQVLLNEPGRKLVYATDFADTPPNRERMVQLARHAHSLFCEAPFMLRDRDQAQRTQHLSTEACAEIANRAEVGQLLPFHFSKRYLGDVPAVYRELAELCPVTVVPRELSPLAERPPG